MAYFVIGWVVVSLAFCLGLALAAARRAPKCEGASSPPTKPVNRVTVKAVQAKEPVCPQPKAEVLA